MTFLNAWAAGFAAIGPVIVLLYLLKLKRRPLTVSTLLFWQRLLQENRQRALFQRLRRLFSLLLHLLIFALILGALAHPTLHRSLAEGSATVLILDSRARMQAVEADGQSRFKKAQTAALNFVREAGAGRPMAIVAATSHATVIHPFSEDEKSLSESVRELEATDAAGTLESALELANHILAAHSGRSRIIVITDRAPEKASAPTEPGATTEEGPESAPARTGRDVQHFTVGSPRDNVAITRFATRAAVNSPQTSDILLDVGNFSDKPARVKVELAYDGRLLDVKPLELEPGAHRVQVFPTVPRPGNTARGWLTARLDQDDALAADNVAYAVLPVDPPKRVLLVSKGNWFLEKLLTADQSVSFELISPNSFNLSLAAKFDAVILDNFLPEAFDPGSATGNFLFLKKTPFNTSEPALPQPLISDIDQTHPVMRVVNLQNVTLLQAAPMALPKTAGWTWQAPVRSFEHPLLIVGEKLGGAQRTAALALDIGDSDLPMRVAFPLLISNTVHWLSGENTQRPLSLRAGESLALAPGETVTMDPQSPWHHPVKKTAATPLAAGIFAPVRNGFYAWNTSDGVRWIAVNTFDDRESDLRAQSTATTNAFTSPAVALGRFAGWPLWQWLCAAGFMLFSLEWWLFHRRRTE